MLACEILECSDPAGPYRADFVRAVAAATDKYTRDLIPRLRAKFGRGFSVQRFKADIRDAKAEILRSAPTDLILNQDGLPKPVLANAVIMIRRSPLRIGHDAFLARVCNYEPSPWGTEGIWTDIDDLNTTDYLQHHGVCVDVKTAHHAAMFVAHEHVYHPLRTYLQGLAWDQQERLTHWLVDCLGVENNEYTRGVGKLWMISAVARAFQEGCKADQMLVLEGEQGKLKSSALRMIANGHMETASGVQWFSDTMPDIDHKDIGMHMQGTWIIEMSDLDAIRRADWTSTKKFISMQNDRFRSPYGYNVETYPRQCVFAGSTNEEHWIGDRTGGRRFWAVKVGKINLELAGAMRDQLWAEATWRYQHGEQWHGDESLETLAKGEQAERQEKDVWLDLVRQFTVHPFPTTGTANGFQSSFHELSFSDVMEHGLHIKPENWHPAQQKRARHALKSLGWKQIKDREGEFYEPTLPD